MNNKKIYTLEMRVDQKIFLEEKYNNIKKYQPLVKQLKNIIIDEYTDTFLVLNEQNQLEDYDLNRLINDWFFTSVINDENYKKYKMKDSNCHENSYIYYLDKLEKWEIVDIMYWYALSDDWLWREHSWISNECGDIIETTVERVAYYWFILNKEDIIIMDEYYGWGSLKRF